MTETSITADGRPDLTRLDPILSEYRGQKGAVIPVLQKAQKIYGYLPPEVLRQISAGLRVPLSRIYGVATFYSQFYLTRRGRHIVRQCDGTACHVRGAGKIVERMEQVLGIPGPRTTTASPARWSTAWVPAAWRRWPSWTTRPSARSRPKRWSRFSEAWNRQ